MTTEASTQFASAARSVPASNGAPGAELPPSAEQYRRELLAHCYRMTGSVHDAEDLVQETYLRAWRAYHSFEGRSSVRTWLYRIATNVCLTALEGKDRRPLPTGLGQPGSTAGDPLDERGEVPWLEPAPDALLSGPEAAAETRESIRLAFVAALQHLPARQRAVLILRDVLRWKAAEVAEALGTSTAAVNSALQRAHAQMEKVKASEDTVGEPTAAQRALLERYVEAFWDKDIDAIVSMLTRDAIWEMPPFAAWYQGNENIGRLIDTQCPGNEHDMPMVATWANGQPAFGLYMRQPDGGFAPFHLQVLTLGDGGVQHVAAFFSEPLFATFGLPERLPADHRTHQSSRPVPSA
jgi:RNA polymerase sigma-70 factor (ECF subfamily)